MIITKLRIFCFCSFFWVYFSSFAQNKSVSLKNYLADLENSFAVKFSYLDKYVSTEVNKSTSENLKEILVYLEKQLQLRFEFTDTSRIILRPFKQNDLVDICGNIYENDLAIANVKIQSVLKLINAKTNSDGYFKLEKVPYGSELVFRKNGQLVLTKNVKKLYKVTCPNLQVTLITEVLNEITIQQYLTKGIEKNNQKTIFKPKEFSVLAGLTEPDIMNGLQHIPGVQNPFETASNIYVRGGAPDQNLILWNGIKTYNQSHFFGLISAFNPYLVTQVDFYNKGVNAKYGDRVAGVIDMKSTQDVAEKFEGGFGANLIHADAFARIPIIKEKLSVEVAGRRSYNDFWESITYKQMAERVFQNTKINESSTNGTNDFYFVDYSFGLQAELSKKDKLQLNSTFAKNNLDFQSMTQGASFSDKLLTESEGYSLQWQRKYSEKFSHQSKVNWSNYLLDYEFSTRDASAEAQKKDSKQNFINDFGVQTFGEYVINKNSKAQLGYEFSENNIRYSIKSSTPNVELIVDEQKNKLRTHSFFGEYSFDYKKLFIAELGVRTNKYSVSKKVFVEPRLFLQGKILPHFYVNSSFTLRSQAITQIQESVVSSLSLENQLWRITDSEDFKVLQTQQLSFGASYKDASWFIEGDSYYKKTNNVTTLTSGFLTPASTNVSSGESKIFGAELFVKKKFKDYATWVSYSYSNQKSRFENINDNDFFTSNLNIQHTFKWLHFYKLKDFQFSVSWLWHTGKATTDSEFVDQSVTDTTFNEINTSNLPVYHKLDLSSLYNFKIKPNNNLRYQIGLSILNLYNRKSIINREFKPTPGIDDDILVVNYSSQGITPNLSLRVFW